MKDSVTLIFGVVLLLVICIAYNESIELRLLRDQMEIVMQVLRENGALK